MSLNYEISIHRLRVGSERFFIIETDDEALLFGPKSGVSLLPIEDYQVTELTIRSRLREYETLSKTLVIPGVFDTAVDAEHVETPFYSEYAMPKVYLGIVRRNERLEYLVWASQDGSAMMYSTEFSDKNYYRSGSVSVKNAIISFDPTPWGARRHDQLIVTEPDWLFDFSTRTTVKAPLVAA